MKKFSTGTESNQKDVMSVVNIGLGYVLWQTPIFLFRFPWIISNFKKIGNDLECGSDMTSLFLKTLYRVEKSLLKSQIFSFLTPTFT